MERRSAERYSIDLQADVACLISGDGSRKSTVKIRDISSVGAAFFGTETWSVGDPVSMVIRVGDGLVGPFSYNLQVRGRIVREEFEESHGRPFYAVAFDRGFSLSDWMEAEYSGEGRAGDDESE